MEGTKAGRLGVRDDVGKRKDETTLLLVSSYYLLRITCSGVWGDSADQVLMNKS